ncbi:hypothetical protein TNCV_3717881 [Trichonephila clavipes]|nr:hypothetical protein TNCV_3717881 [Trichonephila clavipes]
MYKNALKEDLIRVVEDLDGTVESTDTIAKLKTKILRTVVHLKETATHIGIREAEDWFRPIDLAKECDIYISSRSGSHKEIPITYGYTQDPFKNRSQNFKPKIKENYPQYLERENKNCYICGDSSHCARDCAVSVSNVPVSSVIKNSSYDLPHVKNFNTRNDLSSLVKNYKCNNIKSTKLKMCIKLKNDIPVCQRPRRLSCSDSPSPMKSKYRRFAMLEESSAWQWKRRGKRNRFEQTSELYRGKYRCILLSGLDEKGKRRKYRCGQRTVRLAVVACSQKQNSVFAQAQLSETKTETMRTETVETFELVKVEQKL